ncbi:FxsA family protein [Streptomyces tubbatahanensis]|uniref:FxsA family protein n=1 Tax=Streptomyces tubbatahanensis TaxID=2923272 RepID=A0ABY3XNQ4_9ACTN|nr:FxsA family membrane protein [Streptomyces tubbatahanensis]UNS95828.1 FxsA family protein [Streptomyces tubbatahanensis]
MTTRAPFPYGPSGQDSGGGGGGPGRGEGSGSGGAPPPRPPRSRARTLVPLAVAAWIVLEIWLLILVGEAAGGFTVFLVLVAGLVLGSAVIKRAGRRAWNNLAETVQHAQDQARAGGRPDGTSPDEKTGAHGRGGNGTAMLGGLLLMIPGLLTDVAGLLCLFPPTAKLLRGTTERFLQRRSGFPPGGLGDTYQQARAAEQQARMHRPDGKVVQGEVVRDDEPQERGGGQGRDAERGRGGEQGR